MVRILLVLDINGTFLESTHKPRSRELQPDGMARAKTVYFRPYMKEFLQFVLEHFDVGIWTSNIRSNAQALVRLAFTEEQAKRLKFVFAREQCRICSEYKSKKPLQEIWRKFTEYNNTNTYIVDDSFEKVLPEQISNHMYIEPFVASAETLVTDNKLQRLEENLRVRFLSGA